VLFCGIGCSNDQEIIPNEESKSSAEGKWSFTIPGETAKTTFELVRNNAGNLEIKNAIHYKAPDGPTFSHLEASSLQDIELLRISNYCASPHCSSMPIEFLSGHLTLSGEETLLSFASITYYKVTNKPSNTNDPWKLMYDQVSMTEVRLNKE
jgi:hypothetical protein